MYNNLKYNETSVGGTMNKKRFLELFKVTFSNFMLLLAGVVTSFILPKYFDLEDFGYYKIFNLYTTYIIVLQFGISEGLYLKYGGKSIENINRNEFSSYFKALAVIDICIAFLLFSISIFFLHGDYKFIIAILSVNVIILNITNLYQYISQAISHFTELAVRNTIKSMLIVLAVISIAVLNVNFPHLYSGYKLYIILLTIINFALMLWYLETYRTITKYKIKIDFQAVFKIIKIGFPLCLSNIISTLILAIDRQMVSMLFETSQYAIYAFAYSLLTLASTIISSIAVVFFPILKQKNREVLSERYCDIVGLLDIAVSFLIILYFPLCAFIEMFLPAYKESLEIFRIIIPGLVLSSPTTVVIHNYFKAYDINIHFFIRSLVILVLSAIANGIAYVISGTMASISAASVIVIFLWYIVEEQRLKKEFEFSSMPLIIYMLTICLAFYLSSLIERWYVGMFSYLFLFVVISIIICPRLIKLILKMIKRRIS